MDKRLINTLLRIFHSPDTRFACGRAISAFCAEYNLGVRQGSSLIFNAAHKAEIGRILKGELGIDGQFDRARSACDLSWRYSRWRAS